MVEHNFGAWLVQVAEEGLGLGFNVYTNQKYVKECIHALQYLFLYSSYLEMFNLTLWLLFDLWLWNYRQNMWFPLGFAYLVARKRAAYDCFFTMARDKGQLLPREFTGHLKNAFTMTRERATYSI